MLDCIKPCVGVRPFLCLFLQISSNSQYFVVVMFSVCRNKSYILNDHTCCFYLGFFGRHWSCVMSLFAWEMFLLGCGISSCMLSSWFLGARTKACEACLVPPSKLLYVTAASLSGNSSSLCEPGWLVFLSEGRMSKLFGLRVFPGSLFGVPLWIRGWVGGWKFSARKQRTVQGMVEGLEHVNQNRY